MLNETDREKIRRAFYLDRKSIRQLAKEERRGRRTIRRVLSSSVAPPILTPVYNCARIKLTPPRYGCNVWSMSLVMHIGGSHDQEQDSEYHT